MTGGNTLALLLMQAENLDVSAPLPRLPGLEVVVAVNTVSPAGTGKLNGPKFGICPPASLVTVWKPRKVRPSPFPDASQATLEKNSRRNVVLGASVWLNCPDSVTLPAEID